MIIRHVEDYYEAVKKKFPDLEIWEIDKILKHGFQSLFTVNNLGADVLIKSAHNSFTMYFGKLFNNPDLFYKYRFLKHRMKIRINYFAKKTEWDGYYYFGLTEEEYQKYFPKKKGRYKYKITFDKLIVYKIREEAQLFGNCRHFFKLKMDEPIGMVKVLQDFSTRNITEYARRNSAGKIEEI